MKQHSRIFLSTALAACLFGGTALAAPLSPALIQIAEESSMVKTGNPYTGILFTQEDFKRATSLGEIESITITSLPAASAGTLYLGSVPLAVNQSISGENLDNLKFLPTSAATDGSFSFTTGGGYSMQCALHITDEVNFAPVATGNSDTVAAWTQKDISCYGTLEAYDPEGDTLHFEIVEYPTKGLLTLTDASHGDFSYTPYAGYTGEDHFTYCVRDENGNYSENATLKVMISRQDSKLVFADMTDHWAHSAAISMVSDGIMDYTTETGMALFRPDEAVSREDFLVMVMRTLGFEADETEIRTVFADDSEISPECRAYVSAAYNAGIIRGRDVDGQICFCPHEAITRAETAVMMNNIIGAEVPVSVSLFTDNDTVPVWAQSALYALHNLGILRGTGSGTISPYTAVTRAQAAQLLLNFSHYLEG